MAIITITIKIVSFVGIVKSSSLLRFRSLFTSPNPIVLNAILRSSLVVVINAINHWMRQQIQWQLPTQEAKSFIQWLFKYLNLCQQCFTCKECSNPLISKYFDHEGEF